MKPELAIDVDLTKAKFPLWGFPKIDGVRMVKFGKLPTARSLLPHANKYTTNFFSDSIYNGIDGELTIGDIRSNSLCRNTVSAVNTIEGEPNLIWNAFDYLIDEVIHLPFHARYEALVEYVAEHNPPNVTIIPYELILDVEHMKQFYNTCRELGYEGAVYRDPFAMHKDGRTTVNENAFMRMKPYADKEALVISVTEALANNNVAKKNALGHTERSSHKENKVGKGMVGVLICEDPETKKLLNIQPGKMKHKERIHYFNHPEEITGQIIKYRLTDTGIKDAPRFGRFLSIRSIEDTKTA